jgi:hypothetical protein
VLSNPRLLLLATGAAWLAGLAASGQRYPGLSRAWLLPAAMGFILSLVAGRLLAAAARRLAAPRPSQAALVALAPLWLVWPGMLALLVSSEVNHFFANWPRLRAAAVWLLVALCAFSTTVALLRWLERRHRALSGLGHRLPPGTLAAAGCFALYLASAGGHLYTPDEWTIYAVSAGLATHGRPAAFADEPYPLHVLGRVTPPAGSAAVGPQDGYVYTKYGVLPSLLAAPLVAIARVTGPGPELSVPAFPYENRALPLVPILFNPVLSGAASLLLFQAARALGYGSRAALLAAIAFATCSLAWPYSKTLLNMTLAATGLIASFTCLLRAKNAGHSRSRRWLILGGLAAGIAAVTRYECLLFALPLLALILAPLRLVGGQRNPWPALRNLIWFAVGLGIVGLPFGLAVNFLRTGSLLDPGYGPEGTLAGVLTKPWYGWYGLLLSPGCGLLPHTPLMMMGVVALIWMWEDAPGAALAAGSIALLSFAYYGSLSTTWCAFATWGPRYLLVVAPFTALPLAALFNKVTRWRNPILWVVFGGVALWSAGTNLLAVLVDFNRGWQDHWALGATYLGTTWIPYFSGITSHFRLLREWLMDGSGGIDLYFWYLHPVFGPLVVSLLLLACVASWTAAWLGSGEASIEEMKAGAANWLPPPEATASADC